MQPGYVHTRDLAVETLDVQTGPVVRRMRIGRVRPRVSCTLTCVNRQTQFERCKRETDRQTDRHTDTQTDRQTDRQTHRQTDRQTDRQIDRQTVGLSKILLPYLRDIVSNNRVA